MLEESPKFLELRSFDEREGFMTIGNLFHAPNIDSVLYLKKYIWPEIRKQLPTVSLSIYGNYASQQINELHNEKEGFLIKGWASSVKEVMSAAKVCLAPLRFGAGLKGKLFDAMIYGVPVVTTSIGGEGLYGDKKLDFLANTTEEFIQLSVSLYNSESLWEKNQGIGLQVLKDNYLKSDYAPNFKNLISTLMNSIDVHRKQNFMGQVLQHQTMQATRYMSKWIEEKNK